MSYLFMKPKTLRSILRKYNKNKEQKTLIELEDFLYYKQDKIIQNYISRKPYKR